MQQSLSLPLTAPTFFLRLISFPQSGGGKILDVAEVEQELLVTFVLDEAVKLIAHFLDVLIGDDLGIDEADDRDPVHVLKAEVAARGLRHRGRLLITGASRRRLADPEDSGLALGPPERGDPLRVTTI